MQVSQPLVVPGHVSSGHKWRQFLADVRRGWVGYLFITPLAILFAVYYAYPIVRALWLSVTNYHLVTPGATKFVGLTNYVNALNDQLFVGGLVKAGWFTVLFYPGAFILPLMVALLLDRVRHPFFANAYRTLLYVPAIVPGPLIIMLWKWMYMPSIGFMNYMLVDVLHLFATRPLWVTDAASAIPSVAFMEWWWGMGQMSLFFLVGLSAIPNELYEASRLDGASEWQVARFVSLPLIKPTVLTWLVIKVAAFGIVVEMLLFEGPQYSLWTWGRYVFELSFTGKYPLGYTTAMGWLGAIVMIAIAFGIRRLMRVDWER